MSNAADLSYRSADRVAVVTLQESVYPLEVIFKACYLFTDRCYLFLKRVSDGSLEVHVTPKSDGASLDNLVGEFCNELVDQRVRSDVWRESGKLREIIIAQAFAEGNLLESSTKQTSADDYNEDPLGIGDYSDRGKEQND